MILKWIYLFFQSKRLKATTADGDRVLEIFVCKKTGQPVQFLGGADADETEVFDDVGKCQDINESTVDFRHAMTLKVADKGDNDKEETEEDDD